MPAQRNAQGDGRLAFARFACWLCLIAPAAIVALVLSQGGPLFRLTAPSVFMLTGLAGLWLLQRRRNEAAFRVVTYGSWLATLVALSYTGGLLGNSAAALPVIVVFSAWLAGIRNMLFLSGATVFALFGYALLDLSDLLPVRFHPPVLQRAFIHSLIVVAATALGYFATRTLTAQLKALGDSRLDLKKHIAALARREQELSLLSERVPAMIAHIDHDGLCRFANSAYARFHGQSPESVVGMPARDIVGAQAYADMEEDIRRVLDGEPVSRTVTRLNADGERRSLAVELVPDRSAVGDVAGWYALIRDVTESERAGNALRHIIEGTARATGTAFFRALARNLAQATGLRCAMVAEVLPDRRHARAIAYWTGEDFREGAVYLLAGAPCQRVVDEGEACFPDRVAELFPLDKPLATQGIRGYYGVRLEASDGAPLGVLVVMDGAPIRNRTEVASLVAVFAARAAAELERLRADAELQRSAERFAKVFATSPIPIAISSLAEGRYADVNPAYEQAFGWKREEAIGRTSLDLGLWPSREERQRWVAQLTGHLRTRDFETTLLRRDGEPLSVLISAEIIDLEGVPCIINFVYDQTQRKRAEDAMRTASERFEAIFQNTPNVAIQGYDVKGTVMHWNHASEIMYGIPAGEAIGKSIQSLLFTPETAAEFEAVVAGICGSGTATEPGEWPLPLRDGREIWVMSTMFPVFSDGILVEIFCMDVDITEMKRSVEEARLLNVMLEARVAARTAELAELNRELEAFSYSVSHDLRAPLRGIDGFGRLLEQDYADRLDDTGRDYILRMRRAAQRLAQLIDDLLDLTRIDRAELRPADIDLSALAEEIVAELRLGAPQRKVDVSIEAGLVAHGDPQLMRIALQNLLDNAWKYSSKVEDAHVRFGCERTSGECVFFVRDNGAGFDMAFADKLFAPFQRLHSPRDFEGTGVGLASVARTIKRHGGRVWAESTVGRGAVFYFTLGSGSPD
ncbi:MAG: PAS domain S-box protein [Rhodocyclaceae bacterium]|nr:PAS domain S-box protein [Rhodocyclaceae bacterium]